MARLLIVQIVPWCHGNTHEGMPAARFVGTKKLESLGSQKSHNILMVIPSFFGVVK